MKATVTAIVMFAAVMFTVVLSGCSDAEKAKAEAEKAKADAEKARAELELAKVKAAGAPVAKMPVVVEKPLLPAETAPVSNVGIVLDKGTFATDMHLTNRDSRNLDDVELNAKLYFPGFGLSAGQTLELSFNKSMPLWRSGQTVSITNFATYDFQRVVITGSASVGGKKVRIMSKKDYK
jgi:hypothetical protein